MDKIKSSKGVIKVMKHEKQASPAHCYSMDKNRNSFQVKENDFPSLSEVSEKNSKSQKNSATRSVSALTYSSKLKSLLAECSSQNIKFENMPSNESKEPVSSKELLKNESPFNSAYNGRHIAKPLQSNQESLTKKSIDSKSSFSFSEQKNNKHECFNEHINAKTSGKKSLNDNSLSKTVHKESNAFEKIGHASQKVHNLNNGTITNNQSFSVNKRLSPRKVDTKCSPSLKSNIYNKRTDRPNINPQHKRLIEANRSVNSRVGYNQDSRLAQPNVMYGKVNEIASNKTRIINNPGSQMAYTFVKTENKKTANQSLNEHSSLSGPNETKKKRKRKSKLKRQAALQTGKIMFLTPEVHSKIVSQSNNVCFQTPQNILTNINDSEEYPELGLMEPKSLKKSPAPATTVHSIEESQTDLTVIKSNTAEENLLSAKDFPINDNLEAATKSVEKEKDQSGKPESEKPTKHSNIPITLSLFDMLTTAKARKKELEVKDESADENNISAKTFKKEMSKRNASQAVNPFASSKLTIKRGKEREKPRVKRPSRMRKLILMERQLRKETMALKRLEKEDENQEKSEGILSEIHTFHDIEKNSSDNVETIVENLLNFVISPENVDETCDMYDGVNQKIPEQFQTDGEDVNIGSTEKNLHGQTQLDNEIMNNVNQFVKSYEANISKEKIDSNGISCIADLKNDFVTNPDTNLKKTQQELDDFADSNGIEGLKVTCDSAFRKISEDNLELKNNINTFCTNENQNENVSLSQTENICLTYDPKNIMQESNYKLTVTSKNLMSTLSDINIITNVKSHFEIKSDSTDVKQSSEKDSSENASATSFSDQERLKATKLMLHSRKFRQYCNHFISKEIDQAVFSLIDDLARFQDRMYQKDPVKAKVRRRLVYGIKEIKKHMKLKKVKGIIIATDIEDIKIEGGLNDSLGEMISLAEAYHIPCVFSHLRYNLGRVCRKSVPVSCVGIFNYEGSEKNFKKMIELHDDSKHDYMEVIKKLASELTDDKVKELFKAEKESILYLREVSQKILKEMVYFTPEGYRNNEISQLEKTMRAESKDSNGLSSHQSEDFNPPMLKKLDKDKSLLTLDNAVNTILVKYKVVKEP